MSAHVPTALVATSQAQWRRRCAERLLEHGCDIHTASNGFRGLDLLRKHIYDIIVVDDSFSDISPLEFSLTATELAPNVPLTLVAGHRIAKLQPILNRRDVYASGSRDEVLDRLGDAVRDATAGNAAATRRPAHHLA